MPTRDIAAVYLRWIGARATLSRGYWLVAALYLVVVAELSAFELLIIGVAQGLIGLTMELPTGVMADTLSRKWSVVVSHVVMGSGMLVTGLVTSFPALVVTQMVWGLGWTFASGADVAWLTDELDEPARTPRVLTRGARFEQLGAAVGLPLFGALAWITDLGTAIVVSGGAMIALGLYVAARFSERNFEPVRESRWRASAAIFRRGASLVRRDGKLLLLFAAWVLINGAGEGYERLLAKHLVALGFPEHPDPIVWFTLLGVVLLVAGALSLRVVEARIDGTGAMRRMYVAACAAGAVGLVILSLAPDEFTGMAGAILVAGVALPVTRCISVIWVNRRATSDVRATLQSMLGQAEYFGEIVFGLGLGFIARASGIPAALSGSCALVVIAGLIVLGLRTDDAGDDVAAE